VNREAAIPVEELVEELAPQRRFRPYPEYRESDIDGVCAVPAHWADKPLKYVAAVNANKFADTTDPDYELEYVDIGNVSLIEGVTSTETYHFEDAPSRARRRVQPGDTIISTVRTYLKAVARIDDPPENLVVSTGFAVLHAGPALDPAYLYRVVQSDAFVERVVAYSVGVSYPAINPSDLVALGIPVPPLNEQRAIAAFLDRETARIDELIAKKQRLIELLAEKRTALISHAVTKGLNPNASMKDSGIDWIGSVPEHWQVIRIKFVAQVGNGCTPSRETPEYWNGWFPWLNSSVVNLPEVTEAVELVSDLALRECHLPRIYPPAVLVGITGEGKTRGMATLLRIEATINQHLAFIRPTTPHCMVEYVRHVLHSAYHFLRDESSGGGSTKGAITCEQLGGTAIPYPPASEQSEIVRFIDDARTRLDALTAHSKSVIAHLNEYRSALISAAVTGKIDVREGATA